MGLAQIDNFQASAELNDLAEHVKLASDFLKALSHESRLLILCILAEGEKTVTDLEALLNLRQPTVSQQLARLRMDGLVTTRRSGKTIFYSLASDDTRQVIKVLYDLFCARAGLEKTH